MAITSPVGFLFNDAGDQSFKIESPANTASFEVDAVLRETHTFNREATDNEVENGSPVADHIIKRPITLEIQAIVTDQPITATLDNYRNAIDRVLQGSRYTEDCFGALVDLYDNQDTVTIYTDYRTYDSMAIENITIDRSPDDGESLIFNISAKQIRKVSAASVKVPPGIGVNPDGKAAAKGAAAKRADPGKDLGQNTGLTKDNGATILKQTVGGISTTIGDLIKSGKQAAAAATGGASF